MLDGEDLHVQVQNMITDVITAYVDGATAQRVRGGLGHRHPVGRAQDAVPDLGDARLDRHGARRPDQGDR